MNTANCPEGLATDQVFRVDNPEGTCDTNVAAYISLGVLLTLAKGIVAVLHARAWLRRQRKLYAKVDRKKHYPIVPGLSILGFVQYLVFFPLTITNVANAINGWSFAIHATGWLAFGVMSIFFLMKIVRLGRRLVPIIKEKKLNELLEQQMRDDDDPPTWSSTQKGKNALAAFANNPMFEDDPPTYDEASSLPNDHQHESSASGSASTILGQNLAQGRLMLEKQMIQGRTLLRKQVEHGRMILNGGKVPEPPTGFQGRPRRARTKTAGGNKVGVDAPPKNPMWEEDPPTTYSILEIVEPQLDRLKRLDLVGQIFFLNGVLAVLAQFFVFFFVVTLIAPGQTKMVRLGFALEAFFVIQHAVSMSWQYRRVIRAVRESKRKSRRNDINIENGVSKLRKQQTAILVLSVICGTLYILVAASVIPALWYVLMGIMFVEIIANAVILRTLSSRMRGKIHELKKQQANLKSPGNANNNNNGNGNNSPNLPQGMLNNANGGGGNGGYNYNGDGNGGNGGDKNGAMSNYDNAQGDDGDGENRVPKYRSEVAHVRESTKFVTDSSRKLDEKDGPTESTISW